VKLVRIVDGSLEVQEVTVAELQVRVPYSAWGSGDEWQEGYEEVLGDFYEAAEAAGVGDDDADHFEDVVCFYLIGDDVELLQGVARAVLVRHDLLAVATVGVTGPEPGNGDGGLLENPPLRRPVGDPGRARAEAWNEVWVSDDDRTPHIPRSHLLVGVEYMSRRYSPHDGGEELLDDDETEVDDDAGPTDPLLLGRRDLFHDPTWKTWLDDHMRREDVDLSLRIDEVPTPRVTHGHSRPDDRHSFTSWIPVEDFLGDEADEPAVFLKAHCRIYRGVAREFDVPEPPPDL
jgi:hypothetical protein